MIHPPTTMPVLTIETKDGETVEFELGEAVDITIENNLQDGREMETTFHDCYVEQFDYVHNRDPWMSDIEIDFTATARDASRVMHEDPAPVHHDHSVETGSVQTDDCELPASLTEHLQ